jgi:hypothetical protein
MLIISGSVCAQAPRYFLQSNLEAQQIRYKRSVNVTSCTEFGIELKKRWNISAGAAYRWHENSNKSDFFTLRWMTLNLGGAVDFLTETRVIPGVELKYARGIKLFDIDKSVDYEINPAYYPNSDPNDIADFSDYIQSLNYELQANVFVKLKLQRFSFKLYSGILTRKIILYNGYLKLNQSVFPIIWNNGISFNYYFN